MKRCFQELSLEPMGDRLVSTLSGRQRVPFRCILSDVLDHLCAASPPSPVNPPLFTMEEVIRCSRPYLSLDPVLGIGGEDLDLEMWQIMRVEYVDPCDCPRAYTHFPTRIEIRYAKQRRKLVRERLPDGTFVLSKPYALFKW